MTDHEKSLLVTGRRSFLKELAAISSLAAAAPSLRAQPAISGQVVQNCAPLAANAFYLFPAGSIRPRGWLLRQLRIQADGLSGHLDETWPDVGPNSGWLGGAGESWERGPYFVDGLLPLAYLLDDSKLKAKAQKYIEWTLAHPWSNGMIGPPSNDDWWSRMVILKALTQYHELTADPRVIPFMSRYFAYQLSELPKRPLRDWGKFRWQDEVLSVIWLYNRTGDAKLLELARLLHDQGHDWQAQYRDFQYKERITADYLKLSAGNGLKDLALSTHGVNNGQAIKTGPVWSLVSGSAEDRRAVLQMIAELDRYHGLPNGMFSCDEHLAGRDPSQGSELCTVVEYMFSLEQSLAILGEPSLGDKLEQLAFNALPGTFDDAMWAHQYDQQPNQVECSLHRKPWSTNGPESNLFGLEPNFGCCTANFHQGWPKFVASLFMMSADGGITVAAYSPSQLTTSVQGTALEIVQQTDYPFRRTVELAINPATSIQFPIRLRIPAWGAGTKISVNGQEQPTPQPSTFATLARTWKKGDRVVIEFPFEPRTTRGFNGSVAVERGPLVFSHPIGESWVKLRDRGLTADWQIFPTSSWNYALAPSQKFRVSETTITDHPFSGKQAPVSLEAKARKLPSWRPEDGSANPVPQSPVSSDEPEEIIRLVPYAAAKLRITAFPELK